MALPVEIFHLGRVNYVKGFLECVDVRNERGREREGGGEKKRNIIYKGRKEGVLQL